MLWMPRLAYTTIVLFSFDAICFDLFSYQQVVEILFFVYYCILLLLEGKSMANFMVHVLAN